MRIPKKFILRRIPVAISKLWTQRDELSFSKIRMSHLTYMLPLTIILTLLDQPVGVKYIQRAFLGSDTSTAVYVPYIAGTLFVLLFGMKRLRLGMRVFTAAAVVGFAFWVLAPAGDLKTAAMALFQFGIGSAAIYATYAHVFVLNNAERLISILIATFFYGLLVFLQQQGVNGVIFTTVIPGLLVITLAVCAFRLKREEFPDIPPEISSSPPCGLYVVLAFPFAFFTLNVFGEAIANLSTQSTAMHGIGTLLAVFVAIIIQFGFRRNVWYLLNLFLVFTIAGIVFMTLPVGAELYRLGAFLFGVGDGFGFIMTFTTIGVIKKYRNDTFFRRITGATMGSLLFAMASADILSRVFPEAIPAAALSFAVLFLLAFQLLSPVIQRYIFGSDWIGDFARADMSYITKKIEQTDHFEGLGLSPREKDVAILLLQGLTLRQISANLGIAESTAGGYCRSLYRKLGINSKTELLVRFGVIGENWRTKAAAGQKDIKL